MRFNVQIIRPFVGDVYSMAARSYREAAETAVRVHYLWEATAHIQEARNRNKTPTGSTNVFLVPEIHVQVVRTQTKYFKLRATLEEV